MQRFLMFVLFPFMGKQQFAAIHPWWGNKHLLFTSYPLQGAVAGYYPVNGMGGPCSHPHWWDVCKSPICMRTTSLSLPFVDEEA